MEFCTRNEGGEQMLRKAVILTAAFVVTGCASTAAELKGVEFFLEGLDQPLANYDWIWEKPGAVGLQTESHLKGVSWVGSLDGAFVELDFVVSDPGDDHFFFQQWPRALIDQCVVLSMSGTKEWIVGDWSDGMPSFVRLTTDKRPQVGPHSFANYLGLPLRTVLHGEDLAKRPMEDEVVALGRETNSGLIFLQYHVTNEIRTSATGEQYELSESVVFFCDNNPGERFFATVDLSEGDDLIAASLAEQAAPPRVLDAKVTRVKANRSWRVLRLFD
jgi:hypothetical protein